MFFFNKMHDLRKINEFDGLVNIQFVNLRTMLFPIFFCHIVNQLVANKKVI